MDTIFKYHDYRQYLRDLYEDLKAKDSKFSFRYFSKQAGFSSPNYLKLVMDGDRNLTQKSLRKFQQALKLNPQEASYFENLVHYTQAQNITDKNHYYQKLASSSQYLKLHKLEQQQLEYFGNWHAVAIYELMDVKGFRADPLWISCHMRPTITMKEAKTALQTLIDLNLITVARDKTAKKSGNLITDNNIKSIAAFRFQQAMIDKAKKSLETDPQELRDISSLTIAIPKKRIGEVKTLMQNFRRQLHAMLQDEDNELVYQINLQMFPLTQMPKKRSSK